MIVRVEVPQPARETYASFIERGGDGVEQEASRFWGVQVVIMDERERVFLRRDPDGRKLEGHLRALESPPGAGFDENGKNAVFFPNTRTIRFNGVSGGAGFWEAPVEAAQREMEEELGARFLGNGEFLFNSDVPVFACYQEGKRNAWLLAGLLITYQASREEGEAFLEVGRFWPLGAVYRRAAPRSANDLFRPAFRIGVWILHHKKLGRPIEELVGAVNQAMIETAGSRAEERGVPLKLGVFAGQAERPMREVA